MNNELLELKKLAADLNSRIAAIESKEIKALPKEGVLVKSYEEACELLGLTPRTEADYEGINFYTPKERVKAFTQHQLEVIIKAVNGDWVPTATNKKHYPYFDYCSSSLVYCSYYDFATPDGVPLALTLETPEKAKYVGEKFVDLYNKMFL